MKTLRKIGVATVLSLCALLAVEGCSPDEPPPAAPGGASSTKTPSSAKSTKKKNDEADFFPLGLQQDFLMFPGDAEPDGVAWKTEGDEIVCRGEPKGYIYSREAYDNFTLRFDYRFLPTASPEDAKKLNTGVLLYITGGNKVWPESLEVQGKYEEMGHIKPNGGAPAVELVDNESVRLQARKPSTEWNSVEIVSKAGALSVILNGTPVCESKPGKLQSGPIGFQSEGVEVHFRNIRLMIPETESSGATAAK